ncbi:MAG: phage terminase large subunit, partial [Miltoncostaeaceae bacterium]
IAEGPHGWREDGDPLHPARYDLPALERIRSTLGETAWSALYQQNPVPSSGGMFRREWFGERYTCQPEDIAATADEVWLSADAASKGGAGSDFHAMQVWARKGATRYLLSRVTERMGLPEFEGAMADLLGHWGRYINRGGGVLVEDTANGAAYLQTHAATVQNLIAFHPGKDTPGTDKGKSARAVYLARAAEAGHVVLPASSVAPWVGDWIDTVLAFPVGAHDDDVDAASQINMRWTLGEGAPRGLEASEAAELLTLLRRAG